ncbi:hypothetical protein M3147_09845 [Agromyces mediolanus]|uniref:hypothetical protein n=1 Tax=Agromyces mediolanus TaxID=41986 RepID=UPI00203DFCD6|nr:hypothetical protein [Agromyces mediolanus]MCM3657552.1 hypothetical protein [Agromyces mediolanus]
MHAFKTVHAEPRDSVESPVFRVNFWQRNSPGAAWSLDAYVLTDIRDVNEVLRWVDLHADGRRFEVFAEMDPEPVGAFQEPRTTSLLRLIGEDPNAGDSVPIGQFIEN